MMETDFPQATPDDAEDVSLALTTASALWKNDNRDEALRWLRKAADAAEQAGDDPRALALARAAADLRSVEQGSLAPSPTVPDAPQASATPELGSVASGTGPTMRRGSLPPKPPRRVLVGTGTGPDGSADSGVPSSQPGSKLRTLSPSAPPKPRAEPDEQSAGMLATAAAADITPIAVAADAVLSPIRTDATLKSVPAVEDSDTSPGSLVPAKTSSYTPGVRPDSTAKSGASPASVRFEANSGGESPSKRAAGAPASSPAESLRFGASVVAADELPQNLDGAFQVAIKQSARDADLFLVRPLGKGQPPPPGYKLAYLMTPPGTLT